MLRFGARRGVAGVENDGDAADVVAVQGDQPGEKGETRFSSRAPPRAADEVARGVEQVVAVDEITIYS